MDIKKGTFVLLAGVNGAGKSTIRERIVRGIVKHYANPDVDPFIDPDKPVLSKEVIENEKKWRAKNPDSFAARCATENLDAWFSVAQMRDEGLGTESNLVSRNTDARKLKRAKKYEMRTELHFIGVPLRLAVEREKERRDKPGMFPIRTPIDPRTIKDNYIKGLLSIQDHIDKGSIDVIIIYDNSRKPGEERVVLRATRCIENGEPVFKINNDGIKTAVYNIVNDPKKPEELDPGTILTWFQETNIEIPQFLFEAFLIKNKQNGFKEDEMIVL